MESILLIDKELFLFLNKLNSPFFDKIMWIISAKLTWLPLYALMLIALIYSKHKKAFFYIIGAAICVALADQASVHLFKNVFLRLRPSHESDLADLIHLVNNYKGGTYGFVSSHAANSFAIAIYTAFIFNIKWYSYAIIFWAILVSYSRIYLGVHYPGDIIAGALLGSLIGFLVLVFIEFFIKKLLNNKSIP